MSKIIALSKIILFIVGLLIYCTGVLVTGVSANLGYWLLFIEGTLIAFGGLFLCCFIAEHSTFKTSIELN